MGSVEMLLEEVGILAKQSALNSGLPPKSMLSQLKQIVRLCAAIPVKPRSVSEWQSVPDST